jgi:hypothetical protein
MALLQNIIQSLLHRLDDLGIGHWRCRAHVLVEAGHRVGECIVAYIFFVE